MCVCLCNSMLCGNDWDLHLKEIYWCLSVDWVTVAFTAFILMACLLWLGVLPVPLFDLISLSTPGIFSDWTSGQQHSNGFRQTGVHNNSNNNKMMMVMSVSIMYCCFGIKCTLETGVTVISK